MGASYGRTAKMVSLSARRAWIEIPPSRRCAETGKVALRKESVDRNRNGGTDTGIAARSLSARRAWIEIGVLDFGPGDVFVALRKESVDRNGAVLVFDC